MLSSNMKLKAQTSIYYAGNNRRSDLKLFHRIYCVFFTFTFFVVRVVELVRCVYVPPTYLWNEMTSDLDIWHGDSS